MVINIIISRENSVFEKKILSGFRRYSSSVLLGRIFLSHFLFFYFQCQYFLHYLLSISNSHHFSSSSTRSKANNMWTTILTLAFCCSLVGSSTIDLSADDTLIDGKQHTEHNHGIANRRRMSDHGMSLFSSRLN